jgi:hypothetical protein
MPDSRDLGTREREREKKKVRKGRKEIVVTNKELHFDWIIFYPYSRHLTISFNSLIDVINKYRDR